MELRVSDITVKNNNYLLFNFRNTLYLFLRIPSFYFISSNNFNLLFTNKLKYKSFFKSILNLATRFNIFYLLKLKLRGLGYRFKRINSNLYRFYFARTNYIYLHCPNDILIKSRKKRMILISLNKHLLNLVFNNILLLHTTGPYNRRGFTYPRNIVLMKKGKKIV